jgi:hypothetical protein
MLNGFDFCLPTRGIKVPGGPDWLHEIKYDGYRLRVERNGGRVRLITRGGYDWTKRFPWIVEAALKNRQRQFIVDGEAVILGSPISTPYIQASTTMKYSSMLRCTCKVSPIRRELIFRHYAFEVFGLTFDAIPNSSVRLDRQLLNHRINGRLLNSHSSLRSLNLMTNVIFWLVNIGHLSTRSFA